ncbi:MAG: methionyl-tRNA formyltransferase [Patescibacteria group bacterium]
MNEKINFVFFGTSHFSVYVLDALSKAGYIPSLVVTVPDKPKGRKLVLTPPETKVWANAHAVPCLQLATLKTSESEKILQEHMTQCDVGIVASYGLIIPQSILNIPKRGMLNVHPSLLPKLRGASPLQGAILHEKETGLTIMHLDAEMDHGGIVSQEVVESPEWPPYESELEKILGERGGEMLANILQDWVAGTLSEQPQDHSLATFTKKIKKDEAEIFLDDDVEVNLRKIRAYHVWPGAYMMYESRDGKESKKIRILIKKARIDNGVLLFERVVPEGKKEMSWNDFLRGQHS